MPYARTGRRPSSGRRRSSVMPGFRGGARLIWTYETISLSPPAATPNAVDLASTLIIKEGITDRTGVTYMGSYIQLTAVPLAAPAAGTRDNFVAGIVRANSLETPANLDPSSIAVRDRRRWAWLCNWAQPYSAAAVAATQTVESNRMAHVRAKRLLRESTETMWLVLGSQNAAQTWHLDGLISSLWKVR